MVNSKSSKILAASVVVLFCFSAMAVIFSTDDSSAADEKTYTVYIEVINGTGIVSSTEWVQFTSESTNDKLIENANKAFANVGLSKVSMAITPAGDYIGITYGASYNNASYYADGDTWKEVVNTTKDYVDNTTWAFVVNNGYISTAVYDALSKDAKAAWSETGMGYGYDYVKLPAAKTTDCPETATFHYFAEIINANGKVESSKWVEFESLKTINNIAYNGTVAFKEAGIDKLQLTIGEYGISVLYDGSGNASCMYADGNDWKAISDSTKDYINHDTIALSVGHGYISQTTFNALSENEQKDWKSTGYGGDYEYQKIVTESTEGYKPASSGSNNTVLIIVIVVVAVIVIALIAFFLYKKKSA